VATRTTEVLTAWRIYDPGRKVLLDDLRDVDVVLTWRETGRSRDAAVSSLPSVNATVSDVGSEAGYRYGIRIAPHYVTQSRPYFASKDPRFKEARGYVRANMWDEAAAIWRAVQKEDDPLLTAMASHNLALFHEVAGHLKRARDLAQSASASIGRPVMTNYYRELERRLAAQRRLDEQMKAVDNP
jgi:hypothetical protein